MTVLSPSQLQSGGGDDGFEEDSYEGDIEEVSDRLKMTNLEDEEMSDLRWSDADLKTVTPAVMLVQVSIYIVHMYHVSCCVCIENEALVWLLILAFVCTDSI